MGTYVHVSLPLLPGHDARERVGASVQVIREFADELHACGVSGLADDGRFFHYGTVRLFIDTYRELGLGVQRALDQLHSLDESVDQDAAHALWCYLCEWRRLYHDVVQLHHHGIAAGLSSG